MKAKALTLILLLGAFSGFRILAPFPVPEGWPEPVQDVLDSERTELRIELGRMLFYDPLLSRDTTISCESCHSPFSSFTHTDHALSHGIDDQSGTRNAPVLVNLAWQKQFMWDGTADNLIQQNQFPIHNPLEMDMELDLILERLQAQPRYRKAFFLAWQDSLINEKNLLHSLSHFQFSLISANSRYDRVKRGEEQFTQKENRGYRLFLAHCNSCHSEPLFSNGGFATNGLPVDTALIDMGLKAISGRSEDSLLFKIPTLRNIEYSYPYMHDGRFSSLSAVLNHYSETVRQQVNSPGNLKSPLKLSPEEKVELMAFLLCLSDREFVFNPKHSFPRKTLFD